MANAYARAYAFHPPGFVTNSRRAAPQPRTCWRAAKNLRSASQPQRSHRPPPPRLRTRCKFVVHGRARVRIYFCRQHPQGNRQGVPALQLANKRAEKRGVGSKPPKKGLKYIIRSDAAARRCGAIFKSAGNRQPPVSSEAPFLAPCRGRGVCAERGRRAPIGCPGGHRPRLPALRVV